MSRKYYSEKELQEILMRSDSEDDDYLSDEGKKYGWDGSDSEASLHASSGSDDESSAGRNKTKQRVPLLQKNGTEIPSTSTVQPIKKRKLDEFVWKHSDLEPKIHEFDPANSGCTNQQLNANSTAFDCFVSFLGEDIMQYTAEQSNLYFRFTCEKEEVQDSSRLKRWTDTDYRELYCFIAVNFLMAQTKKNVIHDYWTNDKLLTTPIFKQIMSRDRYLLLLRMLHFADNNTEPDPEDKIWKIRKIVNHLQTKFSDNFYPYQNICIDESLLLFKGRVFFKQYIPSKRHRFGVKFFVACDCQTGYVLNFIVYTGAYTELMNVDQELASAIGSPGKVVLTLLNRYLERGHSLFVDNWYTSSSLFSYLHHRKTNACGTIRKNRKHMPNLDSKLQKGESEYRSTDTLLALKWQDKREVRMLTTLHDSSMAGTGKLDKDGVEKVKPKCIISYNANMGGVDRSDMMLSSVECVRKSVKWYKKVYFHLLDLTLLNAHALYVSLTRKKITLSKFQHMLIKEILEHYHQPSDEQPRSGRRSAASDSPLRLTARHFITTTPPTAKKSMLKKSVWSVLSMANDVTLDIYVPSVM